jgi:hypothetical protein
MRRRIDMADAAKISKMVLQIVDITHSMPARQPGEDVGEPGFRIERSTVLASISTLPSSR